MSERTKNDVIKSVYYGVGGFGRVQSTYEKAKQKDKTITKQNFKDWFYNNIEKQIKT